MTQVYSDPTRESDPHALPDVEVFYHDASKSTMYGTPDQTEALPTGWYFWFCFPGCMPDSDAYGPYETEEEATKDAVEEIDDYDWCPGDLD